MYKKYAAAAQLINVGNTPPIGLPVTPIHPSTQIFLTNHRKPHIFWHPPKESSLCVKMKPNPFFLFNLIFVTTNLNCIEQHHRIKFTPPGLILAYHMNISLTKQTNYRAD